MALFGLPFVAEHFWLTGGTCLAAMYLGHRRSEDLDLFRTSGSLVDDGHEKLLPMLCRSGFVPKAVLSEHLGHLSLLLGDVTIIPAFSKSKYPRPYGTERLQSRLGTKEEIQVVRTAILAESKNAKRSAYEYPFLPQTGIQPINDRKQMVMVGDVEPLSDPE